MRYFRPLLTTLLTCAMSVAYAADTDSNTLIAGSGTAVSNRYTDPAQKVDPSDLAIVSYEDAKAIVLETHRLVNEFRAQNGKPPLAIDNQINFWSQIHSDWMAAGRYGMGHAGADERYAALVVQLPRVVGGGENVANVPGNYFEPAQIAVTGWINSPGHRANMLGDYNLAGYGLAKQKEFGYWFFTNFFIKSTDDAFVSAALAAEPDWDPNGQTVTPPTDDFPLEQFRTDVLTQFNQIRREHFVPLLQASDLLNQLDQTHSESIAQGKYPLGDTDFDVRWRAVRDTEPKLQRYIEWYAQVPVDDPNPAQTAVDQWTSDLGRYGELVFKYTTFGCGVAKSEDGFYYFTTSLVGTR